MGRVRRIRPSLERLGARALLDGGNFTLIMPMPFQPVTVEINGQSIAITPPEPSDFEPVIMPPIGGIPVLDPDPPGDPIV